MNNIQVPFHTGFLRNSRVFAAAAARFGSTKPNRELRILSFGCSIGDEIGTLRVAFPNSRIFGCDTNLSVLEICRKTFRDFPGVEFFASINHNIAQNGPYDLIVASAVLCLNPSPADYANVFPFSKFDDIVSFFDENLADNGILIISNAGYRFVDTNISKNFKIIRSDVVLSNGFVNVFNKDGSKYLSQLENCGMPIYARHGKYDWRDEEDVADSIFEKISDPAASTEALLLVLRPVPDGLFEFSRYTRRNIDFAPKALPEDIFVVEYETKYYRHENGDNAGFSTSVSWSSIKSDGMYRRGFEVWSPAREALFERVEGGLR